MGAGNRRESQKGSQGLYSGMKVTRFRNTASPHRDAGGGIAAGGVENFTLNKWCRVCYVSFHCIARESEGCERGEGHVVIR